jgi:hypothetical protein
MRLICQVLLKQTKLNGKNMNHKLNIMRRLIVRADQIKLQLEKELLDLDLEKKDPDYICISSYRPISVSLWAEVELEIVTDKYIEMIEKDGISVEDFMKNKEHIDAFERELLEDIYPVISARELRREEGLAYQIMEEEREANQREHEAKSCLSI